MINISHVRKTFEGLEAVEKVSIHVNRGSIYGLLGSNGAGKTTLLKILAGIYAYDEGEVTIDGQPVFENPSIRDKIFFIQDHPYFFPQYTVKQMAQFYKSIYSRWDEGRFEELAAIFEIDIHKKIHRFSKGIQRQAAFILALSSRPEVLILDEPMDGLDPVMRKKVKSLLVGEVADREMTILISSHNLREVEDFCDYIGIMHKGRVILEKDLDDLKTDTHKIQVAFKGPVPAIFDSMKILHKEKKGQHHNLYSQGKC